MGTGSKPPKPETWASLDGLASPARIWNDHSAAPQPLSELEVELADGYANDRDW